MGFPDFKLVMTWAGMNLVEGSGLRMGMGTVYYSIL